MGVVEIGELRAKKQLKFHINILFCIVKSMEAINDRRQEAEMIRKFHPDKIPIFLNKIKNSKLKDFDNNKYFIFDLEFWSSKLSPSSNSSWSSRTNSKSITPKLSTSLQEIPSFTPNKA